MTTGISSIPAGRRLENASLVLPHDLNARAQKRASAGLYPDSGGMPLIWVLLIIWAGRRSRLKTQMVRPFLCPLAPETPKSPFLCFSPVRASPPSHSARIPARRMPNFGRDRRRYAQTLSRPAPPVPACALNLDESGGLRHEFPFESIIVVLTLNIMVYETLRRGRPSRELIDNKLGCHVWDR